MLGGRATFLLLAVVTLSGGSRADDAPGERPGMKAHVDPSSGRLVPEPVAPEPAEPLPAPAPSLPEEAAPGGGTMVRLKGQFMSNVVATVNPDGGVRVDCQNAPGSAHPHPH